MHLSLLLQYMLDGHSMKPIQTPNCRFLKAVLPFFLQLFLMVLLCEVQILHWGTTFYRNLLSPRWNCRCCNVCARGGTNYMHHVAIVLSSPFSAEEGRSDGTTAQHNTWTQKNTANAENNNFKHYLVSDWMLSGWPDAGLLPLSSLCNTAGIQLRRLIRPIDYRFVFIADKCVQGFSCVSNVQP